MQIYVAASSKELDRARWAMGLIEQTRELTLAYNWVENVERVGAANGDRVPVAEAERAVGDSLLALDLCDVLWVLQTSTPSFGSGYEMGHFCAKRESPIVVLSGGTLLEGSIFNTRASNHFLHDGLAFGHILKLLKSH